MAEPIAEAMSDFPLQKESPRPEAEIMQNWGTGASRPVVSICCATFNHAGFIEDALRGFLAQITTFPFEIIVRDDASTDGTSEIVADYAKRYPNIIRPVINPSNRFGAGERAIHVWPSVVKGDYIAVCEGDDFWISREKIAKQVALLEENPVAVVAAGGTHWYRQEAERMHFLKTTGMGGDLLQGIENYSRIYFHTSTYLIRTAVFFEVVKTFFAGHTLFGDAALRAILNSYGPTAVLSEVVSVYRITEKGIWTSLDPEAQLKWALKNSQKLATMLQGKHKRAQRQKFSRAAIQLIVQYLRERRFTDIWGLGADAIGSSLLGLPKYAWKKLARRTEKTRPENRHFRPLTGTNLNSPDFDQLNQ